MPTPFRNSALNADFERFIPQQMVAKIDQKLPVFACIWVGDRSYVRSRDRQARIAKQAGMQRHLNRTRIGWRQQLRTRQIEFQEFVGHMQATLSTTVE